MKKSTNSGLNFARDKRRSGILNAYSRAAKHTKDPKGVAFLGLSRRLNTQGTRNIDKNLDTSRDHSSILYDTLVDYTEENSQEPGVSGKHSVRVNATTTLDYMQHESLVLYTNDIIEAFQNRLGDRLNAKFDAIDSAFEGYTADGLDCCEEDVAQSNTPTKKSFNYKIIPVVKPKVVDISTHLANILTPPTNIYGTISPKDKMQHAKAVAGMMNVYAQKFGHYTQIKGGISDLVKYNLGGIKIEWKKQHGLLAVAGVASAQGVINPTPEYTNGVVFEGASLEQLDVRNIFWDITCKNVAEASKHGQFIGVIKLESLHAINAKIADEEYFGDTYIPSISPIFYRDINNVHKYYNYAPELYNMSELHTQHRSYGHNHGIEASHAIISNIANQELGGGFAMSEGGTQEIVEIYIKLQPSAWHLPVIETADLNVYKLYKIVLLNGERIIYMDEFKVGHGGFPIIISNMDSEAQSIMNEKSIAENLMPIQQHINELMKKDQMALSKSIAGGLMVFDKNILELQSGAGAISGVVAAKATSDKPIRDAVHFVPPAPYSSQAFQQVIGLEGLLETIAPSQNDKQVADLQRATELQAAATIQAGKKRWLSSAKRIDDCLLGPVRQFIFHLMLQNEKKGEILSENGEMVPFSLNDIIESGIEFTINNGLQGLDRVLLGQMYEKLIQTLIQAQMTQGYNMEELINYRLSLAGDQTDFTAFKVHTALDNLPPQAKQMAAELFQSKMTELEQAAANGDEQAVAMIEQMQQPNPGNFAPQ